MKSRISSLSAIVGIEMSDKQYKNMLHKNDSYKTSKGIVRSGMNKWNNGIVRIKDVTGVLILNCNICDKSIAKKLVKILGARSIGRGIWISKTKK